MKSCITPLPHMLAGLLALAALPAFAAAADNSGTVTIQLPEETAQFMPGPGSEAAHSNCVKCHSADYIYMQPPLTREQWQATVTKMKKIYGAPIDDKDIDTVVNYLMSQNGKS